MYSKILLKKHGSDKHQVKYSGYFWGKERGKQDWNSYWEILS